MNAPKNGAESVPSDEAMELLSMLKTNRTSGSTQPIWWIQPNLAMS
jgi:hypothetical protein